MFATLASLWRSVSLLLSCEMCVTNMHVLIMLEKFTLLLYPSFFWYVLKVQKNSILVKLINVWAIKQHYYCNYEIDVNCIT